MVKGLRYSKLKNMLQLIPPIWTWGLGDVLTRGAIKYKARNFEKGMPWGDIIGPLKRHVTKWEAGEVYDSDTGCHHMFMVAWNALTLAMYQLLGLGTNDLGVDFFRKEVKNIHTGVVIGRPKFEPAQSQIEAFKLVNNKPIEVYVRELIEQGILNADGTQKTDEELKKVEKTLVQ